MTSAFILDIAGERLAELLATLAADPIEAQRRARQLDAAPIAAVSLGVADARTAPRETTVAAAFILAHTRHVPVVLTVDPARQHPVHVARAVATLSALHGGRVGVLARADAPTRAWHGTADAGPPTAADYLELLSGLWDSWPLDAVSPDGSASRFVDDTRIVRVEHPRLPGIGGPLTLPTDGLNKPPLLLLHDGTAGSSAPQAIDLVLHREPSEPTRYASASGFVELAIGTDFPAPVDGHAPHAGRGLRAALGLGPSRPAGLKTQRVFEEGTTAQRV